MKKIYDTKFTFYILDKKEAELNTSELITNKDVLSPSDYYIVIKERKTKETIGEARIDVEENLKKKPNKKHLFNSFKTTKITLYNFTETLTEKQRKKCLNHLTQWCANRTTDTIYLDIDNAPEFNNAAKWYSYEQIPESTEYKHSSTNTKIIWIIADAIILLCATISDIISFLINK